MLRQGRDAWWRSIPSSELRINSDSGAHLLPAEPENKGFLKKISLKKGISHRWCLCLWLHWKTLDKYSLNAKIPSVTCKFQEGPVKGLLCKWSGPAPRIKGTYLFVDEPKQFGHDRKSGVDLNFPFYGFCFYYWTHLQPKHQVWLYFYRFRWISYECMSCLSAGDVQDVHKSETQVKTWVWTLSLSRGHMTSHHEGPHTISGKSWEGGKYNTWNISGLLWKIQISKLELQL